MLGTDGEKNTRTLFVTAAGLEEAKRLVGSYKQGHVDTMNAELWQAKRVVDSTLHPGAFCFNIQYGPRANR